MASPVGSLSHTCPVSDLKRRLSQKPTIRGWVNHCKNRKSCGPIQFPAIAPFAAGKWQSFSDWRTMLVTAIKGTFHLSFLLSKHPSISNNRLYRQSLSTTSQA
ncbi:hypothetical protein PGT21_029179 [Puccinia graminis f. sp. tritici]|uniref:Uncharacterized protein n=1 Tax=Puccinia graminis f. sp. tritici TaxID=56615 RepID=A0A5B0PAP8_PUCGR|nr:hypothetical protein PGT21_029179 [Puccinia graminis f. sp. tritici]KAA1116902.1 hypothetical protein PGTUg99_029429 [Puccinia graminis f. sp. tritici]